MDLCTSRRIQLVLKRFMDSFESERFLFHWLKRVEPDVAGHMRFHCPCGGRDHYATIDRECLSFGVSGKMPLHCYPTEKKWAVQIDAEQNVLDEETRYQKLCASFAAYEGKSVSAEEAFLMVTSWGCPADLLEIEDPERFNKLIAEHKESS